VRLVFQYPAMGLPSPAAYMLRGRTVQALGCWMKLESPVIDLEPHEWRRIVKWFYKPGWPPWDWEPFISLYVLSATFAFVTVGELLGIPGF